MKIFNTTFSSKCINYQQILDTYFKKSRIIEDEDDTILFFNIDDEPELDLFIEIESDSIDIVIGSSLLEKLKKEFNTKDSEVIEIEISRYFSALNNNIITYSQIIFCDIRGRFTNLTEKHFPDVLNARLKREAIEKQVYLLNQVKKLEIVNKIKSKLLNHFNTTNENT